MSPNPISPDEQLVADALTGDKTAFGDLYECYLNDIYHYIYYRVSCPQEAEAYFSANCSSAGPAGCAARPRDISRRKPANRNGKCCFFISR